jgi:Secretion system C-terminal sorting domain
MIMPNPANQYFSVETFSTNDAPTTLNIYNAQGILIHTLNPQTTKTVSTTEWAVGGYFYEYTIEGFVMQRGKLQIIR